MIECFVKWIYTNLSDHSGNRFEDTTVQQFGTDRILKVISDITLAHSTTQRHRSHGVAAVQTGKFSHGSLDHTHLRAV